VDELTKKSNNNIPKYRENQFFITNTKIRIFENITAIAVCF
jgi:hypothetical protein